MLSVCFQSLVSSFSLPLSFAFVSIYSLFLCPLSDSHSTSALSDLRLAIFSILAGAFGDLIVPMGICCSSFVVINMGTSARDYLNPEGNTCYPSVSSSNTMLSR